MSTQTGDLEINTVEGPVLRGRFRSLYDKNVGWPSVDFAARVLHEGLHQIGVEAPEDLIRPRVAGCTFTTPGEPSTQFEITLTDDALVRDVADRLPGYWETYYLG